MVIRAMFTTVLLLVLAVWCTAADDGADLSGLLSLFGDALGGGDSCQYNCNNGLEPRARKGHVATTNGCGTDFFRVDVSDYPDFEKCCNKHDVCYDTCDEGRSSGRHDCDQSFQKCMKKVCKSTSKKGALSTKKKSACTSTADLMYSGVVAMGCGQYMDSQKEACVCKRPTQNGL